MRSVASIIALIIVIVGAINWFLVGVFSFDIVSFLFGGMTLVSRIVYGVVGAAGLWLIGAAIVDAGRKDARESR